MNAESLYVRPALEACVMHADKLPATVARAARLALSVLDSGGFATAEEITAELGPNWVIHPRTPRIVEKYGEDVRCVSSKAYQAAQQRAIEKRFPLVAS